MSCRRLAVLALVALACASCGQPRRYGDEGGVPVAFQVAVDKAFFSSMRNHQVGGVVGAGGSWSPGYGAGFGTGVGVGITFTTTSVYILGGEGVGQADVFRQEVKWGDNHFTVPLKPGHVINLSVHAEGGRQGWEVLGPITVPAGADPRLSIALGADGPKVTVAP
jgi:hypothetical protein